ncbi:MAG TPA: hypothetical protein VE971_04200 [Candidatus Eisenbacteria bacterium]|nr:hypothetical protein [Candidatus Eisenbacteria bacterium]
MLSVTAAYTATRAATSMTVGGSNKAFADLSPEASHHTSDPSQSSPSIG